MCAASWRNCDDWRRNSYNSPVTARRLLVTVTVRHWISFGRHSRVSARTGARASTYGQHRRVRHHWAGHVGRGENCTLEASTFTCFSNSGDATLNGMVMGRGFAIEPNQIEVLSEGTHYRRADETAAAGHDDTGLGVSITLSSTVSDPPTCVTPLRSAILSHGVSSSRVVGLMCTPCPRQRRHFYRCRNAAVRVAV